MMHSKYTCRLYKLVRGFSSATHKYDLAVIGGGPGGYTTAIKAAQYGLKVACIDRRTTLGGTCLNVGCIPSKCLLNTSHHYKASHDGIAGIKFTNVEFNHGQTMSSKAKILKTLDAGIKGLFKKNGVDYISGHGTLKSANEIQIEGGETVSAKNIIIATGSEVTTFPGDALKIDGKRIISSDEALVLDEVPKEMVVIGGGAIGLELASVWSRLGAKVTIVEYANNLCHTMDHDVSVAIKKIVEKQGINILLSTKVLGGEVKDDCAVITAEKDGEKIELKGDVVLLAMGRRPYTKNLGLEELGIKTERGYIVVDEMLRVPNYENISAIGDVIAGPMLAHKAEEDGSIALGHILGKDLGHINWDHIPMVIYTHPEVAGIGKSEQVLKSNGIEYKKATFPFAANSRARIAGDVDGFVKILADKDNKILGGWIVGPHASELIGQITIMMACGLTTVDVAKVCFAHPTVSEALKEACMAVHHKATHF
ncbi:putative dihydrolipoamide dehydrogenase [Babesia bovis T2Bo]|uniref:Dihydrolipoyl dehydrogenase n=1 Tax=Babesia bovis TaxID=5865 RepID=A7ARA6_BABBO|nr:putative dihydrolipoamide dehydrogenase [Babesia bovis T2Bo]EDO07075.1 putative dihydrolipoamide dehydrogenase [Babesia bovis T2Bo]|eukprot:XP_001610643.1 dihydrolipoamide dehydrogenase [Babesia bovis T2Bo]